MHAKPNAIDIQIAPPFRTHVTPRGVIEPEGTIEVKMRYSQVGRGHAGVIFKVTAPGYSLEAGFTDEEFYIKRNGQRLAYPLTPIFMPKGDVHFFAMWAIDQLGLTVLDESFQVSVSAQGDAAANAAEVLRRTLTLRTAPTLPPNSLLAWARSQAIAPTQAYDSREVFYQTVASSLESIQDVVASLGAVNAFWDVTYDGPRIATRLPKRETDIQPTIRALLFNIAIAKNLEVSPEYPISGGSLDFLISAPLSSGGMANACVEFKHAHSDALLSGLLRQLPTYMRGKASDYGIYAVLFFKGKFFKAPSAHDPWSLRMLLEVERRKAGLSNVLVLVLDVSHVPTPSRR
jgi:hypothetical protein